jgi:hypothetical protein
VLEHLDLTIGVVMFYEMSEVDWTTVESYTVMKSFAAFSKTHSSIRCYS